MAEMTAAELREPFNFDTKMNVVQLRAKLTEWGVHLPPKSTKPALVRLADEYAVSHGSIDHVVQADRYRRPSFDPDAEWDVATLRQFFIHRDIDHPLSLKKRDLVTLFNNHRPTFINERTDSNGSINGSEGGQFHIAGHSAVYNGHHEYHNNSSDADMIDREINDDTDEDIQNEYIVFTEHLNPLAARKFPLTPNATPPASTKRASPTTTQHQVAAVNNLPDTQRHSTPTTSSVIATDVRRRTPVQAYQDIVRSSRGPSTTTSKAYLPQTVEHTPTPAAPVAERASPLGSSANVTIDTERPSPGFIPPGVAAAAITPGKTSMTGTQIMPAARTQTKVFASKNAVSRNQQSPAGMAGKGKSPIIIIDDPVVAVKTGPGNDKSANGGSAAFNVHRCSDRLSHRRSTGHVKDSDFISRLSPGGGAIVLSGDPLRFNDDYSKKQERQQNKDLGRNKTESREEILKHMAMALALRDDGWVDDGKLVLLRALELF